MTFKLIKPMLLQYNARPRFYTPMYYNITITCGRIQNGKMYTYIVVIFYIIFAMNILQSE